MSHGPELTPTLGTQLRRWWILPAVGTISVFVAFLVYVLAPDEVSRKTLPLADALYAAGALLLLHAPDRTPASWLARGFLQLAKVSALGFTGFTLVAVAAQLFANECRVSKALRGDHTVICGLDFLGRHLVEQFRIRTPAAARAPILIVDENARDGAPVSAVEARAGILRGNPTSGEILRKARVHRAARVIAATLDDAANIAVALAVIDLVHEVPGHEPARPDVFIHIADPQVRLSLRRRRAFLTNGYRRVTVFNVFENSARLLLRDHPLDYVPISKADERVVQLIIVGFGRMGEAVLTRAALVAHYANGRRLRALVIDRDATAKEDIFYGRYGSFREVCDARFLEGEADAGSTQDTIVRACADPLALSTVVICLDHDTSALALAFSLIQRLPATVPVRLRLNADSLVQPLVGMTAAPGEPDRLTVFGSLRYACRADTFADPELDAMARAVHKAYVGHRTAKGATPSADPSLRPWDLLDDELVDSNRQLADHIPVKIRALGCRLVPKGAAVLGELVDKIDDPVDRGVLAELEHQRWFAERLLAGWTIGEKNVKARTSPYLRPWEITVLLKNRNNPAPAACVGESAVDQHHCLLWRLLCGCNCGKHHQDEKGSVHIRFLASASLQRLRVGVKKSMSSWLTRSPSS
jgi:hypothetical protein